MTIWLVTGGAGFIGSHLCEALVARGDSVRVLDDLSTGKRENLPPGTELIEGHIADAATIERASMASPGASILPRSRRCIAVSRIGWAPTAPT